MIGLLSFKMRRISCLSELLAEELGFFSPVNYKRISRIAGWGLKPRAALARKFSKWLGLPFVSVEDGFLRSYGLGVTGSSPLSVVVDETGMYYDATRPSDLENVLNSEGWETPELTRAAGAAISLIVKHNLSKYNHAPDAPPSLFRDSGRKRVLIVDQTKGDMSVRCGMADENTFRRLYDAARSENPDADIYIKLHPDVIAGKKNGYLADLKIGPDTFLIRDYYSPLSLIKQMDKVYVVTSQMGFEALLLGKQVTCFGMPFYAGWGVTDDRVACPRRTRQRSVREIFAAAYLKYARYINPANGRLGTIFDVIDHLVRQKRYDAENAHDYYCIGFRNWKHRYVSPFLQGNTNKVVFVKDAKSALRKGFTAKNKIVVWGSSEGEDVRELSSEMQIPIWRVEDGFLRSVGLGSDLVRPMSLVLDRSGIYYDPGSRSDLENILNDAAFTPAIIERAQNLRRNIVDEKITKYNTERHEPLSLLLNPSRKVIFVPGQVEDDASIRLGADNIRTNKELVNEARLLNPDAFIIYKPHPDVLARNRHGAVPVKYLQDLCDHVETSRSVISCIDASDEIHTLTSLSGFDALLRGKRVFVYGKPFYAGWGLTEDREPFPGRARKLSLDELVAGALILYPRYWDVKIKAFVEPESVAGSIVAELREIEREGRWGRLQPGYLSRQLRKIGILCEGLRQR